MIMVDITKKIAAEFSDTRHTEYRVGLRGKNLTEQLVEAEIGRLIRKSGTMSIREARHEELRLRKAYLPSSLTSAELKQLEKLPGISPL